MDFHGYEVDVERAFSSIAMEAARRYLDDSDDIDSTRTDEYRLMLTGYFEAYGWLCGQDEEKIKEIMERGLNS